LDGGREERVSTPFDDSGSAHLGDGLAEAVVDAIRSDRGVLVSAAEGPVFVHPFNPSIRLAIVGAVHIAQRLAILARGLGYEVTLIDPRRGFLTEARFPGVALDHTWPDAALEAFALDARSAVVALSHDPKLDEKALEVALRAPCFYVGALGSQRTQERRRDRLREGGLSEEALARIRGPVGLDLGAKSPAEIALSIAAEIVATLRVRS
ncbi:MAG: XdhC/CoxF family protein, partial [Phycisphaeraceae bacterium]|nr:XdhC/CoxF family protein [Phycisphaeraceae bacterium]